MPSTPAGERLDRDGIVARYDGLSGKAVDAWLSLPNFPRPDADGWDARKVDAWMHANRPHLRRSTAVETAAADAPAQDAPRRSRARKTPAKPKPPVLHDVEALAARYGVPQATIRRWSRAADFPEEVAPQRWERERADAWVKDQRPHVWTAAMGSDPDWVIPPPEGHPKDLFSIGGFGELLGNATRGKPIPRSTMNDYRYKGYLPAPDRTDGDGERPTVREDMWFRSTCMDHLRTRQRATGRPD
ncbi:MAG: hypothetical protein HOV68_05400 [Streptomycetaceae bacterium]|nr:hypothetical protein [Streptomycetaceae bacterium]